MALGGVEIGSKNAADAPSVIGIINSNGLIFNEIDSATHSGNKACVTVMFAINWVINRAIKQVVRIITIISLPERSPIFEAIQCVSPETSNPFSSAKPPPKSRMIPHGIFEAVSQSIIVFLGLIFEGIMNRIIEINAATTASII